MLKVCLDCTTRYAPGVAKCPQCYGMSWRPDYEEDEMPKVTVTGGPSNAAAGTGVEEAAAAEEAPAKEEAPKAKPAARAKAAAKDARQDG